MKNSDSINWISVPSPVGKAGVTGEGVLNFVLGQGSSGKGRSLREEWGKEGHSLDQTTKYIVTLCVYFAHNCIPSSFLSSESPGVGGTLKSRIFWDPVFLRANSIGLSGPKIWYYKLSPRKFSVQPDLRNNPCGVRKEGCNWLECTVAE